MIEIDKNEYKSVLPAYAGMIPDPLTYRRTSARAPRVCGDDPNFYKRPILRMFSAPRVCGDDPTDHDKSSPRYGVLPAYAGMIPTS